MLRNGLIQLSESSLAKKLVTGTPLRALSRRFVPGETVDDLVGAIREANTAGFTVTANYLGEAEKSETSAAAAAKTYLEVMERMAAEGVDGGVSLKFTQLGQAISDGFLAKTLAPLLERGKEADLFIRFDMESSDYTQRTLDAFENQLTRMAGREDGIVDGLFRFSKPVSGGYYWCPGVEDDKLDLRALGV